MKKIQILFTAFGFAGFLQAQENVSINATIKGATDGKYIYLLHKYDEKLFTDSAKVSGEKISFKIKQKEPNLYWLTANKNAQAALNFFADPGKVEISGHIDSLPAARVKGGPTQNDFKATIELTNKFGMLRNGLIQRHNAYNMRGDAAGSQRIIDTAQIEERNYVKGLIDFMKQHPNSNVCGYIIYSAQFDWPQIAEYDAMYAALGEKVKKGKFGKLAAEKITSIKGNTIGYPAIDFTQPDINGKNVSLSSFKGKYVLVDFWASWCGPCRRENPNVVAAYNKYKDKGFDILGVSFDDNKDKWLAAIDKDHLTWTHVSDLKGWQNGAGKLYGVQSIPFNLLLDKEGKILAKGLRGPELEAKLAELMGN